ncbi:hypothetical protein PAXRUDRAFT_695603 [Paxillus rubicundulus Ve08.2h10]|uniref:Uncharacterized protein n=1 Tax=Paxillus rubicundulus Ve08.2h10 TaxID=930991 RepID=A0A0D0EBW9_9AGAM|nr:hypothetical protein PAXRUDRAFT_695603 [Paxillus rubicundulus Ve08.2h10]
MEVSCVIFFPRGEGTTAYRPRPLVLRCRHLLGMVRASSIPMVCTGTVASEWWYMSSVQWERRASDHGAADVGIQKNTGIHGGLHQWKGHRDSAPNSPKMFRIEKGRTRSRRCGLSPRTSREGCNRTVLVFGVQSKCGS